MTRFAIEPRAFLRLGREADRRPHPAHQLVAPNSLRIQALELLLVEVRQGLLSETEALALHDSLTELKVRLLGDRVSRRVAWQLAVDRGLDDLRQAEYLAVAKLQADVLIAEDPDLGRQAAGLLPLGTLEELFSAV
jgi:hypothetical protein